MVHSHSFSSARIKLRIRHLLEHDTLAANHRKVRNLVREETVKKASVYGDNRWAIADLQIRQAMRLMEIMACQGERRAQMKLYHKEEMVLFEQVIEALKTEAPTFQHHGSDRGLGR